MPSMDQRDEELQRLREAVDRKSDHAREAAESTGDAPPARAGVDEVTGDRAELSERGRPQDAHDIRAKNSGKGKKTADKWNQ